MNMHTKVELYKEAVESEDPTVEYNPNGELVATVIINVTNLSAARSYRDYGQTDYDRKILRTITPLPKFDYCVIDGVKYVPLERQQIGSRNSIMVKEAGSK
ncbi:hypothetical protein [Convivina intestini]|uniref:Uncharacterized protein n=1 Tax=Convivina intestini TaxID=1505726 RepID=A0A2U1D4F0_9LACO|nr:hypothetical protein [Convivina intestini]PVY82548.1 hypothetical protein C7384_11220 [Convivina intestini]SDC16964.1 hypothetical protein SAMN05216341_1177 [Leuconostocaceae bacterium R-53105]